MNASKSLAEFSALLVSVLERTGCTVTSLNIEHAAGSNPLTVEHVRSLDIRSLYVVAALAEASKAAHAAGRSQSDALSFSEQKEQIDGAATAAGEEILNQTPKPILIRAGEGARDDSPGATLDQTFGGEGVPLDAVIDYVDGTGLVARHLPNALALGAVSRDIRRTPDLKAFAVLVPRRIAAEVTDWHAPTAVAAHVTDAILADSGRSSSSLTFLTHSGDVGAAQDDWYSFLRQKVGRVVVPHPVSVEPPYILSRTFPIQPRIDAMVGVMGLVELVYAAMLLDLSGSDDVFLFRLVPSKESKNLMMAGALAFHLDESDKVVARAAGLNDVDRVFTSDQFVSPGDTLLAGMFAISDNEVLELPSPSDTTTVGLIALPRRVMLRMYLDSSRADTA